MTDFEKLGVLYLGHRHDVDKGSQRNSEPVLYESKDLVTHAVCIGMTGSGKTGLCLGLLEEAAIDGIPIIAIDPKGDLANLLLTFPDLSGKDFEPWINLDDARRQGLSSEEFAQKQAQVWKEGLAQSGQDGDRIRRLKDSCEFNIYTPGASSGLSVSILNSLQKPDDETMNDGDLLRERVQSAATCILALLGGGSSSGSSSNSASDSLRNRDHILISTIIADCWKNTKDVDLTELIQLIQKPPMTRVGALDLESFYPAKERFELSININNILAAPGFEAWLTGEPLDIDRFLWSKSGKPRCSIFSIAHLGDTERMFFVTLLLNQVLSWMRSQSGTTSLRAVLYMDEIFGYFPPVANPPCKTPLLTLLKQARAFGLGIVLATQNPVDIDYKGLSNAGTWFIGRLQTERDKMRVLEGLQSAQENNSGAQRSNASLSDTLSRLGDRVFLMNNVHEDAPVIFKTRFTMSYLRGPLNRRQIKDLMEPRKQKQSDGEAVAKTTETISDKDILEKNLLRNTTEKPSSSSASAGKKPVVAPEIMQLVIPVEVASFSDKPQGIYRPFLLAAASIRYLDSKLGVDHAINKCFLVPCNDSVVPADWSKAKSIKVDLAKLDGAFDKNFSFAEPAQALLQVSNYKNWNKEFSTWMAENLPCKLWRSPSTSAISQPGEFERDFRIRLQQMAFEQRDLMVAKLRDKYSARISSLQDRIRLAEQKVQVEQAEARQHELNSAISIGATVLGAFMSRKGVSSSTIGRATTAARGVNKIAKQREDVGRAEDNLETLNSKLQLLTSEFQSEAQIVAAKFDPLKEVLEPISLAPKKANITVKLLALAWVIS
ncbi:ATP-binding protein [soil metagenome]